jgi:O-antigen/teichoic acid export membrane protein
VSGADDELVVATTATEPGPGAGRRAAGNVAAVAVAQVAAKVLTLAWTVVAARVLSQRDFGEFNFALSLALILSALAEWGFDPALVRLASRSPRDRDRHYTEAILAESVVGLLLFAAVLAAVLPTRATGDDRLAMALVFLAVFVDLWNDTARSVGAAAARQGRTSAALIAQRLATAAFVLPLLAAGAGIAGVAGGMLGGCVVGWLANLAALRSFGSRLQPRSVTRSGLVSFARISLPIGVSSLVLVVVARIDMVLLEVLKGSRPVAAYAAAYKLFETVLFVTFAVSSATFPMMSAAADDSGRVREVARTAIGVMLVLLVPFTALCLADAPEVLRLVFGADYGRLSAGALRWLAVAPLVYAVAYVAGTALIAVGRNRGLVIASVIAAVVNIGANLLVIPHWEGTGAAAVTSLSYLVEGVAALLLLRRGVGSLRVLSAAPEALVVGAVLGLALWWSPLPLLLEAPTGCALYLVGWALLARRRVPEQVDFLLGLIPGRAVR